MTMTFIIIYVVIALILVGLLNVFLTKRKHNKVNQQVEQTKHESHVSNENYQSKFKAAEVDYFEDLIEKLKETEDWLNIEAVRNQRVHDVNRERWAKYRGLIASELILEDLTNIEE